MMEHEVYLNIQQPAGRHVRRRHSMNFTTDTKLIDDCGSDIGKIKTVSKEEPYYRKKRDMAVHCMDDHTKIKKKLQLQGEGTPKNPELFNRRALPGQPKDKSSAHRIRAARRHSISESGFRTDMGDKITVAEPEDDDFIGFFQWSRSIISNLEEAKAAKNEFKQDHRRYSLKRKESVVLIFSSASDWALEGDQEEEQGNVLDLGELCDAVEDEWDKRYENPEQLFLETPQVNDFSEEIRWSTTHCLFVLTLYKLPSLNQRLNHQNPRSFQSLFWTAQEIYCAVKRRQHRTFDACNADAVCSGLPIKPSISRNWVID
jgi:hypothetical protein